jgi:broad specificity phosphatase PhoE
MITIYAVRHGETTFNEESRVQGTIDAPLNEFGRQQAKAVAEEFEGKNISRIISSPLSRALDTAKQISSHCKIDYTIEDDFREISCGDFQGMTIEEIQNTRWQEWQNFLKNRHFQPKNGESMNMLNERVVTALQKTLATSGPDDTIIIVSHAGGIRMMISWLMNISVESAVNFGLSNASIAKYVNKHGRWTCLKWNDTEHLGKLQGKVKFVL